MRGRLPSIDAVAAARALADYDLVIAVGTKVLATGLPLCRPRHSATARLSTSASNTWELAKNQPSIVVYGDERAAIRELLTRLPALLAGREVEISLRRDTEQARIGQARGAQLPRWRLTQRSIRRAADGPGLAVSTLAARMRRPDAILVDESLTAYSASWPLFPLQLRGGWFRLRGGGIGAGFAHGAFFEQLAHPERRVSRRFVGDGSSLYSPSPPWWTRRAITACRSYG